MDCSKFKEKVKESDEDIKISEKSESRSVDGRIYFAVVTLQDTDEVMVVASDWLSPDKKQCYWPPFKSPEKYMEAVKNNLDPEKEWEKSNVLFHAEYDTYEAAVNNQEKHKTLKYGQLPGTSNVHGTKRKSDHKPTGSNVTSKQPKLLTERTICETTEIMRRVDEKVQALKNVDETKAELNKYILEALSKMNKNNIKKKIIGILGESGQGKSSLLNAILEKKNLLPSGCFGACTAVITQIEANLTDSNYTAEIELLTKQEWEGHLKILFSALNTESKEKHDNFTKDAREKINALYGADAEKKTFEELKNDDKFAELTNHFSATNASDFAKELKRYTQNNALHPGGWYWPLVKSVTIKIPNRRDLLEHIVLIDLPGTGDCNEIRDDMWKSKLRECSSVWILSDINRAVTNKDTWEMLKYCTTDMMEAGECRDIYFICTKSDNIEPDEYNSTLMEQIPEDENLKTKCILHRNKQAKETVLKTFENSKIEKEMDLQVFTISSKAFFDRELRLEHDDTEIPKLQQILRTMNMRLNQDLAKRCVTEAKTVMSLIQSKRMTKTQDHMKLERNLEKAVEKLDKEFYMLRSLLYKGLSGGVEQSKSSCRYSAEQIISPNLPKGQGGFFKILQALCNNGGRYRSKAWNRILDLNESLAKHMYDNIELEFNTLFPVNAKTGMSVQGLIENFSIIDSDTTRTDSLNFSDFIKAQENKQKQSLKELVIERKKKIYTSIQESIKSSMASSYAAAAQEKGDGSLKRKQKKLLDDIETLKFDMFDDAKEEMLKKSDELMEQIKECLKSKLNKSIQHSFAQTSKILLDVSCEIQELERLSAQLKD